MTPLASLDAFTAVDPRALSDDDLIAAATELGELKLRVGATLSLFAAEIRHRSRPEAGFAGLAQSRGARTPENLVQVVTGTSKREATVMVRVGELLTDEGDPWLAPVGAGVREGRVSVEKADVIRAGLGSPTGDVAADDLLDAATRLTQLAPVVTVEKLAVEARALRDELDAVSVQERATVLRDRRFLMLTPQVDGMTRLSGLLDPESAAIVGAAFDAATSPRRGGPRFVDPDDAHRAQDLLDDTRTIGQIAVDAFVDLVRLGGEIDPSKVMGSRRHAVRVLVAERDLRQRTGAAFFGDSADRVPLEVADRHMCDAGILPILFDASGVRPLDVGRTQRLFTARQREALAARDGGCRFPDCDRPVSWTEAHHICPWERGGSTNIDNGILLCRHHHMLTHDNGWAIERDAVHGFVVVPPTSVDPRRRRIPMPARSRVAARLQVASRT